MPSSLYASVKQSVVEYAELKKKNERVEERLLFKWKLVTILLAILFIVLVGLFSQYLKNINNLPTIDGDYTFAVPLLAQVNPESVTTVAEAKNLVIAVLGASVIGGGDKSQYNQAQKIYSGQANIVYGDLMGAIDNREKLLFVFSKVYNSTYSAKFGLYAHRGYTGQESSGGAIIVKDQQDSKWSLMFSIKTQGYLSYDNSACPILRNNGDSLTIFESLTTVTQGAQTGIHFEVLKPECFHKSTQSAFETLQSLTGIISQGTSQTVLGVSLDVFALSLNEQA